MCPTKSRTVIYLYYGPMHQHWSVVCHLNTSGTLRKYVSEGGDCRMSIISSFTVGCCTLRMSEFLQLVAITYNVSIIQLVAVRLQCQHCLTAIVPLRMSDGQCLKRHSTKVHYQISIITVGNCNLKDVHMFKLISFEMERVFPDPSTDIWARDFS